ncbi:MAG: molybdopterin-dependent oxidoreductase, partial [Nocardioides sp.]|nr:molybdopterin-dependent oxidoreductase [Nocardioides sp.]
MTQGRIRPTRRRFIGYLVAAPTLSVAVKLGLDGALAPAGAAVATSAAPADILDLEDAQSLAAEPTENLITLELKDDGTVHFALPRMEVGQGIVTSTAMIIAEELDVPVDDVVVTLADARPELVMNQLTGGSNTTVSTYAPIRTAAAIARGRLLEAAADRLDVSVEALSTLEGSVLGPNGVKVSYGDLAAAASVAETVQAQASLKDRADFTVIGQPHSRTDARDAVTGKKQYTMDLDVPNALPTMVCRPPTLNGTVKSVNNKADVLAMPGVTHVATIPTGVAVRAATFGQCIDAVRALN